MFGSGNARRSWRIACLGGCAALALPAAAQDWLYTVQRGDTLIGIATELLQQPQQWRALQRLNRVHQPRRMPTGRTLKIPLAWLRPEAAVAMLVSQTRQVDRVHADGRTEPLAAGAMLRGTDTVQTGPDGAAVIELSDGSRVQLAGSTRLTLTQLLVFRGSGAASTELQLHRGHVESDVRVDAPRPRFEIRTPVMTLGVRGTEFRARVEGDLAQAEVTRGQVVAQQGGGTPAAVPAGFGIVAGAAGLRPLQPLLPAPDLRGVAARVERLPPQLAWAGDPRTVGWRAQVRAAAQPERLLLDGRFADPRATWADLPDGDYLLRVRAIDEQGLEGVDANTPFTLKARPEPPVTLAPAADARSYGPEAQWRWTRSSDAASYRLQVAAQPDFADLHADVAGLAGPEHALALPPGRWYWRLRSVRADGDAGPWGDALPFEQREIPPPPAAGAPEIAGDRLALRWSQRQPGDRYRIQLSHDPGFGTLLLDRELAEPQLEIERPPPGSYHLRVRTLDADGQAGPWSAPSELTVPVPAWWWLGPAALLLLLL